MAASATVATPPVDRAEAIAAGNFPVPTGREEDWRFTPLALALPLLSDARGPVSSPDVEWHADGAVISELPIASADVRMVAVDRAAAASLAQATQATVVRVPAGVPATATVKIRGRGGVQFGHTIVDVAPDAEATVILDHRGAGSYCGNVEIRVGDRARLTFVSVQDWQLGAVHLGQHEAALGRDASIAAITVTWGGDLVRLVPTVRYEGPGGDAELWGLYFADAGQHLEHRIFVDHGQPHCRSRVTYKGALQGEGAHSVWVGDVLIRSSAVGTDTYELNRNLLLTGGARADSVPNLEIETGDVAGAGHASATGRFDDEQLFYLMSRGIPEDTARRLVVLGFFADIIDRVPDGELHGRLMRRIEAELDASRDGGRDGS